MAIVAGHTFVQGQCDCGKRWFDVRWATKDDLGKPGWAHSGDLNERELSEIEAKKEEEESAMVSGYGGGRLIRS